MLGVNGTAMVELEAVQDVVDALVVLLELPKRAYSVESHIALSRMFGSSVQRRSCREALG